MRLQTAAGVEPNGPVRDNAGTNTSGKRMNRPLEVCVHGRFAPVAPVGISSARDYDAASGLLTVYADLDQVECGLYRHRPQLAAVRI